MGVAAQLIINGLIAGSIYSLVAVGFSLLYSVLKFMNFSHGAVVTVGAFFLYTFNGILGWEFWISVVIAIFLSGILGVLMNVCCFKPMRNKKATDAVLLIVSISLFTLLQSLMIAIYGADIKTVRLGEVTQGIEIFGGIITKLQIVIIIVSVLLLAILWWFMKYTKMGKAMRAVSDNKEVAETVGINSERIYNWTFFIASLIAGIAAVLVALEHNIEPNMGFLLIIRGFTGAIIGGVNSVPGAVLGSYLLGLVENIGIWYLPSGYKDAIAFFLLFLFLLFKPSGILGKDKGVKQ